MRRDLSRKRTIPSSRHERRTSRTLAVCGDVILANVVTVALDQDRVARHAARVLEIADHAGEVARINVAQTGALSDRRGCSQLRWCRVHRVDHPVVLMK